jgi:hypothetical protein
MSPAPRIVRRVVAGAGQPAVVLEAGVNCGAEADGTGHNIPGTRPDVVADAILAVAAQVRAATP